MKITIAIAPGVHFDYDGTDALAIVKPFIDQWVTLITPEQAAIDAMRAQLAAGAASLETAVQQNS